jgi:S-adenosylmethionine:tRNA ribosyltransferase-isomerase
MQLSDFHYDLPPELIAQEPPAERDGARMLVVHRSSGTWEDRTFRDLPEYLEPGDCLVLNDSRVIPSRLFAENPKRQMTLLEPITADAREWRALVRPGRRMTTGTVVQFDDRLSIEIIAHGERGERTVRILGDEDIYSALDRVGHIPLPPYIHRDDAASDRDRYQTVFASEKGSVAAPTAGLHFTPEVLARAEARGAAIARVTLHVGLGTFQPVGREDYENHSLHYERYSVREDEWAKIDAAKRVVAIGTTSVRTVESAAQTGQLTGNTNLFLYPGKEVRKVGAMLTNFHLPDTSLLLLVATLAGKDLTLAAYRHAVEQKYRFFSYGDCMLIL